MNEQERQIIGGIFERLRQVEGQQRDPEAERFIADRVAAQPYAPYAMAQAIYIQEQALTNQQQELEALRAEVEQLRSQPKGGGFLSSLFGGDPRPAPGMAPRQSYQDGQGFGGPQGHPGMQPQQGGPWGGQQAGAPGPWGQQAQRPGGGFLASAMTTAAGVAGGMLVANALSSAFGGGSKGSESAGAGDTGQAQAQEASHQQPEPQNDFQQASYDDGGYDSGGFDGGGDWA